MYIAIKINEPIKATIGNAPLGMVRNDPQHVTLVFKPTKEQFASLQPFFGKTVNITVTGYANDGKNEGYSVVLPDYLPYYGTYAPHITIAIADGGVPKDTGKLSFSPIEQFTIKGTVQRFW